MTLFEELKARGLVAQFTNEEEIKHMLDEEKITFYCGFDPTADSLTVGHFLVLTVMKRLQMAGHRPIALLGGGTTLVGDPTGKTDMRKMLTIEQIQNNANRFKEQMSRFIDFSDDKAIMVNNADWLLELKYLEFLREIGIYFSVNRMLTAECFKSRLEKGLTFIEFNYMLMQSYDFLMLHKKYGCRLEVGGDDQWSNILGGTDLIRRVTGDTGHGLTFTLLTTSEGKKMGKTEKGAVWLDPEKTPPYEFYQYWRNTRDDDVIRCMKMLTFVSLDEIAQYESLTGSELNVAKERLAYELTLMVHGEEEAKKAQEAARSLFSAQTDSENMPSTDFTFDGLESDTISVADLLVHCKLAPSRSEAKRNITQGGVEVNDVKVTDFGAKVSAADFKDGKLIIKKGKKTYHRVNLV
ncbi:MAG: tyrosine--tRNA ligase [Ruminococcaceae bacterium]|nr:tyrosine--tRNA ligase [Oscillospiraceae bacterium]